MGPAHHAHVGRRRRTLEPEALLFHPYGFEWRLLRRRHGDRPPLIAEHTQIGTNEKTHEIENEHMPIEEPMHNIEMSTCRLK